MSKAYSIQYENVNSQLPRAFITSDLFMELFLSNFGIFRCLTCYQKIALKIAHGARVGGCMHELTYHK